MVIERAKGERVTLDIKELSRRDEEVEGFEKIFALLSNSELLRS